MPNNLKSPLKPFSIGAWCTVSHPTVAEAMIATKAYDWMTIDNEHCAFSETDIQQLIQICERYNVLPFVRLSHFDPIQARKMLDFGAKGLLLPVTETAEQVRNIIQHIYFPPKGRRGLCLARINEWGETFDQYIASFRPILIPQIESKKGIENIEAILALPEVDGVFLGPYDLSASLGEPGCFTSPAFKDACDAVKAATLSSGKRLGIHVVQPRIDDLRQRMREGYDFIAYGTDLICLRNSLTSLATFKKDIQK